MPPLVRTLWVRSSDGCGMRDGRHTSTGDAMDSWRDGRYHWWRVWYLLIDHTWFRMNHRGWYRVCAGRNNALFHDVEKVFDVLRTFLIVVEHTAFHLMAKPLEMVGDGGQHQYWTILVGTDHEPHTMRTIHSLLLLVTISHAFVVPPPSNRHKIPSDDFVKDAEIKHGRVAMVSGTVLSSLASAGIEHPTAALSQCPMDAQLIFFSAIGIAEAATYLPRLSSMFSLRDDAVPGELIPRVTAEPWLSRIELNVSRVAMITVLLYMLYDVSRY